MRIRSRSALHVLCIGFGLSLPASSHAVTVNASTQACDWHLHRYWMMIWGLPATGVLNPHHLQPEVYTWQPPVNSRNGCLNEPAVSLELV